MEHKSDTEIQSRCTDLEGYIFDLGQRASEKRFRKMKEMEKYLGATHSDRYQPSIMTETADTFPNPDIPTITDLDIERPKKDVEMTYL